MRRPTIRGMATAGLTRTAAVLCPVSYWRAVQWVPADGGTAAFVVCGKSYGRFSYDRIFERPSGFAVVEIDGPVRGACRSWPLASWETSPDKLNVTLSLWIPLALTALPAGLLWRADWRRRARLMRGGCATCGYARAGLAAGAACPECGAGVGAAAGAEE
jgi:hypothetical protein